MSLPPLVFKGDEPYNVWHPVRIAYEISGGGERRVWPTEWYTCCFGMEEVGVACCCAHGCCQPCVWSSALKLLGIAEAEEAALSTLVAGGVPQGEDNAAGSAVSFLARANAAVKGGAARTSLYNKLYGVSAYAPGQWTNNCLHFCCIPCVYCQETNAVIVYAREHYGTPITYGPVTSCTCCYLVDPTDPARKILELPFAPSASVVRR